mmetsp:Transcript_42574/g.100176  ORF Transcript_42574/g.100176 Transcript_42574/m.100176 type:complete len:228 (-) Transcript_42574:141-824(-)
MRASCCWSLATASVFDFCTSSRAVCAEICFCSSSCNSATCALSADPLCCSALASVSALSARSHCMTSCASNAWARSSPSDPSLSAAILRQWTHSCSARDSLIIKSFLSSGSSSLTERGRPSSSAFCASKNSVVMPRALGLASKPALAVSASSCVSSSTALTTPATTCGERGGERERGGGERGGDGFCDGSFEATVPESGTASFASLASLSRKDHSSRLIKPSPSMSR